MKNRLLKSTIIIIICSFFIKMLGLINRIIITRLLGNEGIGLYIIVIPSVMLFLAIGGLSLNIAITKIVSENNVTKKYSSKHILIKALKIGLASSVITIIGVLLFSRFLANDLLKQPSAYFPIVSSIFFIPLVAFNNVVRGYLSGIGKLNHASYASLVEQISRMFFGILLLYLLSGYGVIICVSSTIISMGIGELISLLYAIFILKRSYSSNNVTNSAGIQRNIIATAIPTTLSRLTGNLTYFLEPIIYTLALTIIGYSTKDILNNYSEINAYAIPLITIFSFIPSSISTVIIPKISEDYVLKQYEKINELIKKTIILSFIPAILLALLLTFYSNEYMNLIYNTTSGASVVRRFILIFTIFYIQAPLVAAHQAMGNSKSIFFLTIITSIIKLLILFGLVFLLEYPHESLIYSMVINTIISTLLYYFLLKKKTSLKWYFNDVSNVILLIFLISIISYTIFLFIPNFIISSILITVIYLLMVKTLNFI